MMKTPSRSPVAKKCPETETDKAVTEDSCPSYVMLMFVGKGFKSEGSGSLGIKVSGSMFNFLFLTRGHKYRSRHLWKRY